MAYDPILIFDFVYQKQNALTTSLRHHQWKVPLDMPGRNLSNYNNDYNFATRDNAHFDPDNA